MRSTAYLVAYTSIRCFDTFGVITNTISHMRTRRFFLGAVLPLVCATLGHAQLGVDQDLGTDYITFGSFEGYGDADGQSYAGSFMPEITNAQNFGGFTVPAVGTRCWEHSRWPDLTRYYWRYYQSTANNSTQGSNNVGGRLVHRLHTGNAGMSDPLNGPSWDGSIWNNQYLMLKFYGPTTPNHMVLYQEFRATAGPGTYDFEMRFRSNAAGMRVRVYGSGVHKVTCGSTNGVANQIVPDSLLYDSGPLGTGWIGLNSAITTTESVNTILIQVSRADDTAPAANTTIYFDDIHWYSNDCTPRWTEPQSLRNTYGSVSTGDLCALLDRAITADGSPDHMMINQLRILCGLDGCTPACDPDCPLDLDGSGVIDQPDMDIFESLYGMSTSEITDPCLLGADANGDGIVSVDDLIIFVGAFGSSCEGPGMQPPPGGRPSIETTGDMVLMPNPTSGRFALFAKVAANTPVVVLSPDGRLLKEVRTNDLQRLDIDLTNEPAGLYTIRINDGMHPEVLRVVKE